MSFLIEYRNRVTGRPGSFGTHSHDFYEIYIYLGGEGIYLYFVGDTMYELAPGDVVISRPGVLHASFKRVRAKYKRLYIRLEPAELQSIREISPEVYGFLKNGAAHIRPTGAFAASLHRLTEEIVEMKKRDSLPDERLILFSKVLEQLAILYRAAEVQPSLPITTGESALIHRVIAYINENYAAIRGIQDIADAFSYSKNHLSLLFRREMNHGLHEFLTEKRLSVAAARLRTGESVTECALSCGFSSPSHFISMFKKAYGMTPKAYQTQNIVHK